MSLRNFVLVLCVLLFGMSTFVAQANIPDASMNFVEVMDSTFATAIRWQVISGLLLLAFLGVFVRKTASMPEEGGC